LRPTAVVFAAICIGVDTRILFGAVLIDGDGEARIRDRT
jgi:hypothetical protein